MDVRTMINCRLFLIDISVGDTDKNPQYSKYFSKIYVPLSQNILKFMSLSYA